MSIKRYIAEKDTTITDAFKQNQTTRGTLSNMGASDVLEIFSIYGQVTSSSYEKSRILIQFPISDIISDRNNKIISESGSCQFILKLSNASNSDSTPDNITVSISPVSGAWQEGIGLDMEGYSDIGVANWISASSNSAWISQGGDVYPSSSIEYLIENASDDLELDITGLVENWISNITPNNGLLISLSSLLEADTESYYTKKFFARRSQFFYKRPIIEVRSNSSIKDRRNSFYLSSDLLPSEENLNTLFLINSVRGNFKNIPSVSTGILLVSLYSGSLTSGPIGPPLVLLGTSATSITGGYYSEGTYTASVGISGTYEYLYDVWSTLSGTQLYTGSVIYTNTYDATDDKEIPEYILTMPQLKQSYKNSEFARMRVEVKNKLWDSNIYHVAAYEPEKTNIENLYYRVIRIADNYEVIAYGTGSYKHTLTSYDREGNYFDLDMKLFEPGYAYKVFFGFEYNNSFYEVKETFKFRIDK
jgi:hypothetical protein